MSFSAFSWGMYFISEATAGYFHFEALAQHYLNCWESGGDTVPSTCKNKGNVKGEKALKAEF